MSGLEDGPERPVVGRLNHADVVLVLVPVCMAGGIAVLGLAVSLSIAFTAASVGTAAAVGHALFVSPPTDGEAGEEAAREGHRAD